MPTDAEDFDQLVEDFGGRLDVTRVDPDMAGFFEHHLQLARAHVASVQALNPKLPPVYLDFIHNPDVQAIAFPFDGQRYFIGIYTGTAVVLRLLFHRMLADSRILCHIANPRDEEELDPIGNVTPDADWFMKLPKGASPKNSYRFGYSQDLENIAMGFLTAHEVAHVSRGHVDLWKAVSGFSYMPELGSPPDGAVKAKMRQAIEMHADAVAALSGAATVQHRMTMAIPMPYPPFSPCTELASDVFDWSFAVGALFRLFGIDSLAKTDLTTSNYPPVTIRRLMVTETLLAQAELFWGNGIRGDCIKGAGEASLAMENAFSVLSGKPWPSMEQAFGGTLGSYIDYSRDLMVFCKDELEQQLKPYSHC
jgi:hypothetical protein